MSRVRPAAPQDLPWQKALWQTAFADPEDYIDSFFRDFCPQDRVLVLEAEGRPRSMAALLPLRVTLPDGSSRPARYAYAVATEPAARGRGYGRALMREACRLLTERGEAALTLVPASPDLHRFFAGAGLGEGFAHARAVLSPPFPQTPPGTVTPLSPEAYNPLREDLLAGSLHLTYPDALVALQGLLCRESGGDLLRLDLPGGIACAAVEGREDGGMVCKELLAPPDLLPGAAALLTALAPASPWEVRTPAFLPPLPGSRPVAFGMVRWCDPALEKALAGTRDGYLGFAFD